MFNTKMVPDEGVNFPSTAPMHISLFVLSIGYVMVSHCQQARYRTSVCATRMGGHDSSPCHTYIDIKILHISVSDLVNQYKLVSRYDPMNH